MKRFFITVIALTFLVILGSSVMAEPTVSGPTGLILTPTADITTPESAWLGGSYIDYSSGTFDDTIWSYTLTGGLAENFEVGIAGFYHTDADDGFGINAKYQVMAENLQMPAVSFGINYNDLGGERMTQFYAVASKYIQSDDESTNQAFGIHGGIAWVDADWVDEDFNYWGAVDFNITEEIIGIAEYISTYGANDEEAFTFGVRYYANDQWSATAGMIDGDMTIGAAFIF